MGGLGVKGQSGVGEGQWLGSGEQCGQADGHQENWRVLCLAQNQWGTR